MPGPGDHHADIQERFFLTLGNYLRAQQLGHLKGTSCYNLPLPNHTEELLCPDMSYVTPERLVTMRLRGSYRVGAPDLVIEIASPNDTHPELARKAAIYLRAQVRLLWIVWPQTTTIDVWRPGAPRRPLRVLRADEMLAGEEVVPGFHCPVQTIFDFG